MKKKVFIIIGSVLGTILVLNLVVYLYFSISICNIINGVYETNGKYHSEHIWDSVVKQINVRSIIYEDDDKLYVDDINNADLKEDFSVYVYHIDFFKSEACYKYSYQVFDGGKEIYGAASIEVDLKLKFEGFNWVIVDSYEPYY